MSTHITGVRNTCRPQLSGAMGKHGRGPAAGRPGGLPGRGEIRHEAKPLANRAARSLRGTDTPELPWSSAAV